MSYQSSARANGYDFAEYRHKGNDRVSEVEATLDPDADEQRHYQCSGCGWPCINPVDTGPEHFGLCLFCYIAETDREGHRC